MSHIKKNKEILLNQYPGLWEEINSKNKDDEFKDIITETAQTGDPILRINGLYIHSPRDPLRESQRLAQACEQAAAGNGEKSSIVILGFGLGYSAQAAVKLDRPVIVVERHKSLLLKALELRDFSEFLGKNRIIFVIGGSGDAITSALSMANELVSSGDASAKKIAPYIINNKALTSFDEQWYKQIEGKIQSWTARDSVNTATHRRFGQRWVRNFSRNISAICDYPGISRLSNFAAAQTESQSLSEFSPSAEATNLAAAQAENQPLPVSKPANQPISASAETANQTLPALSASAEDANLAAAHTINQPFPVFLAAAGPSLDKIKPLLRDIYERCVIVAVDTNLRFFIKNGIQPDFVLVVDPQFWNSRHLDRCVREEDNLQTALIAESAVYPPVLKLPFKHKFLCGSIIPLGMFIEKRVDPKTRLGAGGSVASTAWDFARFLGAQEIWIAGLDLSFPDLKTHFHGARFEEISNSSSNRFNPAEKWAVRALRDGFPFKAPSVLGGQVTTDKRLSLYAAWFEAQFAQNKQIQNHALFHEGLAIKGLHAADSQKFLTLPKRRDEINRRIQLTFSEIEKEFNAPEEKRGRAEKYEKAVNALKHGLESIKNANEEGAGVVLESEVKEIADFLLASVEKDSYDAYLREVIKLF
ncbi:hypothetical protein R84B8_03090 [Treponema sp. R8-4-B8]